MCGLESLHINQCWVAQGSLDQVGGGTPKKPRGAFKIAGGAPSWMLYNVLCKKIDENHMLGSLMSIRCGAFVNKKKGRLGGSVVKLGVVMEK